MAPKTRNNLGIEWHSLLIKFLFLLFGLRSAEVQTKTTSFYDLTARTIEGKEVRFSEYRGKVLLIVNTASKCGFTPQLADLESLYKNYQKQGFEVLAFPSPDFRQEYENSEKVQEFAKKEYRVTFPLFEPVHVRGPNKHPVFAWLVKQKKGPLFEEVAWNFEKFLVNQKGELVERYSSITNPQKIEPKIRELLKVGTSSL